MPSTSLNLNHINWSSVISIVCVSWCHPTFACLYVLVAKDHFSAKIEVLLQTLRKCIQQTNNASKAQVLTQNSSSWSLGQIKFLPTRRNWLLGSPPNFHGKRGYSWLIKCSSELSALASSLLKPEFGYQMLRNRIRKAIAHLDNMWWYDNVLFNRINCFGRHFKNNLASKAC